MFIHHALHEVVALHSILVRGSIREMGECRLAQLVFLQAPVIVKIPTDVKTDGPIVILPFDRVLQRLALRMTLDADVIRLDIVEPGGIHDIRALRMLNMRGAGSVTLFATDIPLCDSLGLDVIAHRVASVAKWAGRAFKIIAGIERYPPVGTGLHGIRSPGLMSDVPLNGKRKIIVADFLE